VATDLTVDSGGVRIAVRDFGGEGQALILLHGLGGTLLDWTVMAPLLTAHHHVVALDLRGHGQSGDGEWSWAQALADVAAVADVVGAVNPAVVGHSLGGMLAGMWGAAHPDCPGVVNLDGHGRMRPDQFVGLDPATAAEQQQQLDAWFAGSFAELAGPLPAAKVEELLAEERALAREAGAAEDVVLDSARRSLRQENDQTWLRPDPGGLGAEIMAAAHSFDMLDLYAQVHCPLLLFIASKLWGTRPPWVQQAWAAQRTGLTRDLALLAEEHPLVRLIPIDASHLLVVERPQLIAEVIIDFLAAPPG
jgi:pimeloyl-ACP methyl ester carboxylesterase